MNRTLRVAAAAAAVGFSASFGLGQGVAFADRPPPVDAGQLPSGDSPAPPKKTELGTNSVCTSTRKGGDGPGVPPAQQALDLARAHEFSTGAGQLVAVIDTGVQHHSRLPNLQGGGDYVSTSDGTDDCDAHGTFVAGIIGASAAPGFSGVAPDANILAIRQYSSQYQEEGTSRGQRPEDPPKGYGPIETLGSAIRRAADLGASVINLSLVMCNPGDIKDGGVGAALQYAAVEKDVVVVTAAGNKEETCQAGNPGLDPLHPDTDGWNTVTTNVTPARYDQYALSVGSIDANGQPSKFSVPGPWLGVAAPGEGIVSLNPRDPNGTADGTVKEGKEDTLQGTSFASPYVAGLAALVRSRYPELSAAQVIRRIEATAHAPAEGWNPYVGYGAIDPIAALTSEVPETIHDKKPTPPLSKQLAVPAPPPPPDNLARNVALIGTASILTLLILGYLASFPIRRKFGLSDDDM
ncbi:type VII secretion-associated serine protease mycosin [Nocardia callitridis]|uniref:Type VII secretion-associated serine protease mycosin n=1 Tax=Nocardia callitridis TaxID=648753 RepID=A0ABP9KX37_9NOCA